MALSPSRVADLTNGYEQRSDGLWLHHGKADLGSARVKSYLPPTAGQGIELFYNPDPATRTGYIYAYDRDLPGWTDLYISGRNLSLGASGGTLTLSGPLALPAGSIGTAAIAPNAVQQQLGLYTAGTTFSTTATNVWLQTPIGVSFTTSGGLLRLEFSTALYHSVAGGTWLVGVGWDGVVALPLVQQTAPGANYFVQYSGTYYVTLAAGAHSAQLFVDNASVGTLSINASIYSTFFVTEQRR